MLNKTEWIKMEFVWVPDEAEEQVLEWSWWEETKVPPLI